MEKMAECFRPKDAASPVLGKSADGRNVYSPFCPSVLQLAQLVTPFLDNVATAAHLLPIPKGFVITRCEANQQLQLVLSEAYARRFGRVFGYIGAIKLNAA